MAKESGNAMPFTTVGAQDVGVQKEFCAGGEPVRSLGDEEGLLEPTATELQALFKRIDAIDCNFMPEGATNPWRQLKTCSLEQLSARHGTVTL